MPAKPDARNRTVRLKAPSQPTDEIQRIIPMNAKDLLLPPGGSLKPPVRRQQPGEGDRLFRYRDRSASALVQYGFEDWARRSTAQLRAEGAGSVPRRSTQTLRNKSLMRWKPPRRSEQPMHIAEIKQAAILLGGTVAARRSSLLVKGMAKQEETAA
jgi:hypothetical protein